MYMWYRSYSCVYCTCEGWPACWNLVPALDHEAVHAAGAVLGTGQQLPRADHLYHLLVGVAVVWLHTRNNISSENRDILDLVLGTGQQLPRADHLYHLLVGVAVVRLHTRNNIVAGENRDILDLVINHIHVIIMITSLISDQLNQQQCSYIFNQNNDYDCVAGQSKKQLLKTQRIH